MLEVATYDVNKTSSFVIIKRVKLEYTTDENAQVLYYS